MRRLGIAALAASTVMLAACGSYFRDRSLDYDKAVSTPPLPLSADTRPVKPLYPVPAADRPFVAGKSFVTPYPPAMAPVASSELVALPDLPGRLPVKLGTDGNGVPELRVVGPRERVWDELGRALTAAETAVKDRNQALGLVDVIIAEQPFQVRMVRAADAYVINLQRNDDSLAPVPIARNLLSALQVRWP